MFSKRSSLVVGVLAASSLLFAGCSDSGSSTSPDVVNVGINQLVQHPSLDAATAGFKEAFSEAGVDAVFTDQNANGEQATALSIAQQFAADDTDVVLAVATPAAQATAQTITDKPVLFTAVTDPVSADLVDSLEKPGANVTGTSDAAPIDKQLEMLREVLPEVKNLGIVYSSGEVNSEIQVKQVEEKAAPLGIAVKTQTITSANDIKQAVDALGAVDAIYVPTDNMVVAGIASLVASAEEKKIPVVAADRGAVEGGAALTLGIDYKALGKQTGEMAVRILKEGAKPADLPVETATEYTYVVNTDAAKRQGVTIPATILDKAEKV